MQFNSLFKVLKDEIRRLQNLCSNSFPTQNDAIICDLLKENSTNLVSSTTDPKLPLHHIKSLLLKIMSLPRASPDRLQLMHILMMFLSLNSNEIKLFELGLNENVVIDQELIKGKENTSSWNISKLLGF